MIDTVTLDHALSSARTARRFVAHHLAGHDAELIDSVTLMVSELVTNSVKHSQAPCSVTVELTTGLVHVEVRDAGPDVPVPRSPAHDQPSGRGLQIVAALADDWGIGSTPSGNAVWFRVYLTEAAAVRMRDTSTATGKQHEPVGRSARR